PYCRHFTACGFAGNHAVFLSISFGLSGLTNGVMLKDSLGRCRGTSEQKIPPIGRLAFPGRRFESEQGSREEHTARKWPCYITVLALRRLMAKVGEDDDDYAT